MAILDLHSRCVIGWAISNRTKGDLAIRATGMAIALRSPPRGSIFYGDRGSECCSHDDQKNLREHGLQASMSDKMATAMIPPRSRSVSRPSKPS